MSNPTIVRIDGKRLVHEKFHTVFAEVFGFPSWYGRNDNAWIDCMRSLDSPEDGMTKIHAPPGGVVVIQIDQCRLLRNRRPDIFYQLVELSSIVNLDRIESGQPAVLALAFRDETSY